MIKKIISGGQNGADIAGLVVAQKFGLSTGGTMPFGYKTLDGPRPQQKTFFGVVAHSSSSYPPRTKQNVKDSDGTIRFAYDFQSRGEICTLNAIKSCKKPYIDVDLNNPLLISIVKKWIVDNNVQTLNVAGNSEQTHPGTFEATSNYLSLLFEALASQDEM